MLHHTSVFSLGAAALTSGAWGSAPLTFTVREVRPGAWIASSCTWCTAASVSSRLVTVRWVRRGQADRPLNTVGSRYPLLCGKSELAGSQRSLRDCRLGQAGPIKWANREVNMWPLCRSLIRSVLTARHRPSRCIAAVSTAASLALPWSTTGCRVSSRSPVVLPAMACSVAWLMPAPCASVLVVNRAFGTCATTSALQALLARMRERRVLTAWC
mmetsp:Transcript_37148/g.93659  ORF Transcript_37148/g.93659 Transcript_37148/m.93659 type:complete len:214 (+) Transcript_37148:89-730(+)